MTNEEILKKLRTYDKDVLVEKLFDHLKYSDEEGLELCFESMDRYSKWKKNVAAEEKREKDLEAKYEKARVKKNKAWDYCMKAFTPESKKLYEKAVEEYDKAWENWNNPAPKKVVKAKVEKAIKSVKSVPVKLENNLSLFEMV